MLIDTNEYVHRVNGIPLYYNGLGSLVHHAVPSLYDCYALSTPNTSPLHTSYDFLMSKIASQNLPPTLTPPISPQPMKDQQSRRSSVIMKVENCQIVPASEFEQQTTEHVCRWKHCYRIFETLEKLANHVSIAHSSIGCNNLYYCCWEGCQRSERGFNARYKMLVHCRTHTKEKPHFCTYTGCTKAFSRAENLKIHFRSHTLEKPYRCSFPGCTKAYSNSSDRFKHSRTHQNNKPYMCKVIGCLKRYTDPSSLRKHVKTFNHETLDHSQKSFEKCDETMDCEPSSNHDMIKPVPAPDHVFFNSINYVEHLESNDELCWMTQHKEITDKIETVRLDQPLDLSLRHDR